MFEKDDIGKRVLLELDPEKHDIAKSLGVSAIFTQGTILGLFEDYVKILTEPLGLTLLIAASGKKEKEVPYSLIKDYKFL